MALRDWLHAPHDTLMPVIAAQFGKPHAIRLSQSDAGFFGAVKELPHTGIAPRGVKKEFKNGLGRSFQTHAEGMKAEKGFGVRCGHGGIIQ